MLAVVPVIRSGAVIGSLYPTSPDASSITPQQAIDDDVNTSSDATSSPQQDADGYYHISSAADLYWLAEEVNTNENYTLKAKLDCDITVNSNVLVNGALNTDATASFSVWTPIGNSYPYSGEIDGQGHTVSGLYAYDSNATNIGFLGNMHGTVHDLTITDSYFYGASQVGSIVAYGVDCTISNCTSSAVVSSAGSIVGGIMGIAISNCDITDCTFTGSISAVNKCGGIVGDATGSSITDSENHGALNGTGYMGGISGTTSSSNIVSCKNYGAVTANGGNYIGGIVGQNYSTSIAQCVNYADVSKDGSISSYIGGLIGMQSDSNGTVTDCINFGNVIVSSSYDNAGLCGYTSDCTLFKHCVNANSYGSNMICNCATADISTCYYLTSAASDDPYAFTLDEMKTGKICFLLNDGITDGTQVWYQNIDTEGVTADEYCLPQASGHSTVYSTLPCPTEGFYSNTPGTREHIMTHTPAVTATCLSGGNIDYYTCSSCGGQFSDSQGDNKVNAVDVAVDEDIIENKYENTVNVYPFYSSKHYSLTYMLYTPEEVGGEGVIDKIAFKTASNGTSNAHGSLYLDSLLVYFYETETDTLTIYNQPEGKKLTKVYAGYQHSITEYSDWHTITLDTPFKYSGEKNLIIAIAASKPSETTFNFWTKGGFSKRMFFVRNSTYAYYTNVNRTFTANRFNSSYLPAIRFGQRRHSLSDVAESEATCTTDGMAAHKYCTKCGNYFTTEAVLTSDDAICEKSTLVTAEALGHS